MYKDFRRATRKVADKDLRNDLKNQVFSEFKSHKDKEDNAAIKLLLGEGTRNLARLRSMSEVESDSNDEQYGRVGAGWPWSR
jgi:hypothetical protein